MLLQVHDSFDNMKYGKTVKYYLGDNILYPFNDTEIESSRQDHESKLDI